MPDVVLGESEEYEVGNREMLLPDKVKDDWSDDDLEADHKSNKDFERVWEKPDGSVVVMMPAKIYESVGGAKNALEKMKARAESPKEYPVADEGIIFDNGRAARCIFRDSNALGVSLSYQYYGDMQPDRIRASEYAEVMYEYWQSSNG